MDDLFETESKTSDQKMYIDNTELIKQNELCDVEENKESEEDWENNSCPYCQELFSNIKEVLNHMEVH